MSPPAPPEQLCLLRLSALGDVTHVVPLVRTLRRHWPDTRLVWIVGRLEHKLVEDLPGVEFVVFDKSAGWAGHRAVGRALAGRRFDALLQMQVALRANLLSMRVRAPLRIGYDPARSRDLHGMFVNRRIPARTGEHVLDAIGSFLEPLGLRQERVEWDLPIPAQAREFAQAQLPGDQPTLLVSPCASHAVRNWHASGYAAVADHAIGRHGYRVVLCGGRSELERRTGDAIVAAMREPVLDLIGKDTIQQLLALLERADVVLTPDSGPMHVANAVGTRVIGLHAASNPRRSGPYSDLRFCVDRYDDAARRFRGRPAADLPWGTKLEHPGVMDLIGIDEVIECFDRFAAWRRSTPSP
ncbi:MAG TPA: glycosyltransferase family 9 protein [Xanthomonadaceae bacterium]|nr:glycosyltransferase family 9 protein [Xanthomonadaceae bacterium]